MKKLTFSQLAKKNGVSWQRVWYAGIIQKKFKTYHNGIWWADEDAWDAIESKYKIKPAKKVKNKRKIAKK